MFFTIWRMIFFVENKKMTLAGFSQRGSQMNKMEVSGNWFCCCLVQTFLKLYCIVFHWTKTHTCLERYEASKLHLIFAVNCPFKCKTFTWLCVSQTATSGQSGRFFDRINCNVKQAGVTAYLHTRCWTNGVYCRNSHIYEAKKVSEAHFVLL